MPRKTKSPRKSYTIRRLDKLIDQKETEVKKTRSVIRTLKTLRRLSLTLA